MHDVSTRTEAKRITCQDKAQRQPSKSRGSLIIRAYWKDQAAMFSVTDNLAQGERRLGIYIQHTSVLQRDRLAVIFDCLSDLMEPSDKPRQNTCRLLDRTDESKRQSGYTADKAPFQKLRLMVGEILLVSLASSGGSISIIDIPR